MSRPLDRLRDAADQVYSDGAQWLLNVLERGEVLNAGGDCPTLTEMQKDTIRQMREALRPWRKKHIRIIPKQRALR